MRAYISTVLAVGAVLTISIPQAEAIPGPITINPGLLLGSSPAVSNAIFAFVDAGDTSELILTGFSGNPIFNNSISVPGDTVLLGALVGGQQFGINNLSSTTSFLANIADGDGNYHAYYTTNYADFGVGGLDPAVTAALAALVPPANSVIYVGWEDLTAGQGSDWDYNDLIFVFTNLAQDTPAPEPASLALLGLGIAGLGLMRRRSR